MFYKRKKSLFSERLNYFEETREAAALLQRKHIIFDTNTV